MVSLSDDIIVTQTVAWIKSVVIGCNFCPFAAKALLRKSIRYVVLPNATVEAALETLAREFQFLDVSEDVETTLIILPNDFTDFDSYLDLVGIAEEFVSLQGYEGVYQIASFHPEYCFEGSDKDDPANYTNRSVYPMLHILREESITQAIENYPDPEGIPKRNIEYANQKGLRYMQLLRAACFDL
ncbi:MAG: DUF1415 domain-containing protein [Saprospiraceae bacterium]